MNIIRSSLSRFNGVISSSRSGWLLSRGALDVQTLGSGSRCGPLAARAEGAEVVQQAPWGGYQQVRTGKRGMEYQPKNIKRKRTHGWIKRIKTWDGVEVILRRMLKGRKSLSH